LPPFPLLFVRASPPPPPKGVDAFLVGVFSLSPIPAPTRKPFVFLFPFVSNYSFSTHISLLYTSGRTLFSSRDCELLQQRLTLPPSPFLVIHGLSPPLSLLSRTALFDSPSRPASFFPFILFLYNAYSSPLKRRVKLLILLSNMPPPKRPPPPPRINAIVPWPWWNNGCPPFYD